MTQLPPIFNDYPLLLPLLLIWSLIWKGLALWRASRNESKPWFIALLIVNTFGILEILYLYVWGKSAPGSSNKTLANQQIFQK